MKDGLLLLDGGLESKDMSNHPRSIEERGKAEGWAINALRERRGLMLVRNMKSNLSTSLNRNFLSLSHWKNSLQGISLRKVVVNMVSCSKPEGEDDKEDEHIDFPKASPSNTDDKVLTILEALQAGMS